MSGENATVNADLVADLAASGAGSGCLLGLVFADGVGVGLAFGARTWAVASPDPVAVIARVEAAVRPRWAWWGREAATGLVAGGCGRDRVGTSTRFTSCCSADPARAERLVSAAVGPRSRDEADVERSRAERDAQVLIHARGPADLRNPLQVKAMLAAVGIDVADTRSWRLEPFRTAHPLVEALLAWRKAERIATTYAYGWLDNHVTNGRLRGTWLGSDGAAGRMTASAGLHNLPAELRGAVAAEAGHLLVRADLGQVEPRVLAVVSGDADLARAGHDDDLYAPVAARLGVPRSVAKVAVLAASMGRPRAPRVRRRGLTQAYPVAMRYLDAAYADGRVGRDVRTFGGRLVRMPPLPEGLDEDGVRSFQGARARFARNAVVQGAAAELFKMWRSPSAPAPPGLGRASCYACTTSCSCTSPPNRPSTLSTLSATA